MLSTLECFKEILDHWVKVDAVGVDVPRLFSKLIDTVHEEMKAAGKSGDGVELFSQTLEKIWNFLEKI
jgi:hypothetical protein